MGQGVHTGDSNDRQARQVVDDIRFERAFCEENGRSRRTYDMGPAFCLAAILLSHTGDPSKLTFFDIIPSDL